MNIEQFLNDGGVPLLVSVVCVVYGIRLMLTGDTSLIRPKNAAPLKDEKNYAKYGGMLVIFLGVASALMSFLIFVNVYLAIMEMIAAMVILGAAWKNMNDKYGA